MAFISLCLFAVNEPSLMPCSCIHMYVGPMQLNTYGLVKHVHLYPDYKESVDDISRIPCSSLREILIFPQEILKLPRGAELRRREAVQPTQWLHNDGIAGVPYK